MKVPMSIWAEESHSVLRDAFPRLENIDFSMVSVDGHIMGNQFLCVHCQKVGRLTFFYLNFVTVVVMHITEMSLEIV